MILQILQYFMLEVEVVELPLPMQEQVEVVEPQDILNGATTQQMQVEQVAQEMVEVEVEPSTPLAEVLALASMRLGVNVDALRAECRVQRGSHLADLLARLQDHD